MERGETLGGRTGGGLFVFRAAVGVVPHRSAREGFMVRFRVSRRDMVVGKHLPAGCRCPMVGKGVNR